MCDCHLFLCRLRLLRRILQQPLLDQGTRSHIDYLAVVSESPHYQHTALTELQPERSFRQIDEVAREVDRGIPGYGNHDPDSDNQLDEVVLGQVHNAEI